MVLAPGSLTTRMSPFGAEDNSLASSSSGYWSTLKNFFISAEKARVFVTEKLFWAIICIGEEKSLPLECSISKGPYFCRSLANLLIVYSGPQGCNGTGCFKIVNNYLNYNICSFLETSGGQSCNLYLNVVHFFNTSVN